MPIIKSAKKRVRIARKATIRNSKTKRSLKTALKLFAKKPSAKLQNSVQSHLDKAVKKGVIHKNKAARKKSQLARAGATAGVKPVAAKKAPAKKPVAAKPAAKVSKVTKRPAAKKASSPARKAAPKKSAK